MGTISVSLNYLGVPVSRDYLKVLMDGSDHSHELEYTMLRHVLGMPPEHAGNDVLERYIEISNKETYTAIFPHTDKLFERFIDPFKSAKRMYCLGEYLACIELSAHLGEMLALLLWQITPTTLNGKPMSPSLEKSLWGSEFEKMGQERRIDVLRALDAVDQTDAQLLDFLRATRRKYFHFWSEGLSNIGRDALQCFLKISLLVKNVLKIEYENGTVKLNPLLAKYLEQQKTAP